jgi:hypothetical protein
VTFSELKLGLSQIGKAPIVKPTALAIIGGFTLIP